MFSKITKICFLVLLMSSSLMAQWEDAVVQHLTDNELGKAVSNRSLTVDYDDNLHMLWQQDNNGILELWYIVQSKDGDWSDPIQINDPVESVYYPSIAVAGPDKAYITFTKQFNGYQTLFLSVLTPDGQITHRISPEETHIYTPSLTVDVEGVAHFSWVALDELGEDYKVYYSNTYHLDFEMPQHVEMLEYSKVADSLSAMPSIAVCDDGIVHLAYTGDAGPSGTKIFFAFQNNVSGQQLWNYSFVGESPNEQDVLAMLAVQDSMIHLVYGGFYNGTTTRVYHTQRELGSSNWELQVLLAEDQYIYPEAIFIDETGKVHLTCNRADSELFYSTNQNGVWETTSILGTYPIYRSSIVLDKEGKGYVLAEQGIPESEQVILWGAKEEEEDITSIFALSGDSDGVQVFPNPSDNLLNINNLQEKDWLQINNVYGQVVYEGQATSTSLVLKVEDWETGVYLVNIQRKQEVIAHKILIE